MKRERQGSLRKFTWSPASLDDWANIVMLEMPFHRKLADFLDLAETVAVRMLNHSPMAHDRAKGLHALVHRIRAAAATGASEDLLYDAVKATLWYYELMHEHHDDHPRDARKKITRRRYFRAKRTARSRKELALMLGTTLQGLRKWEAENTEERGN